MKESNHPSIHPEDNDAFWENLRQLWDEGKAARPEFETPTVDELRRAERKRRRRRASRTLVAMAVLLLTGWLLCHAYVFMRQGLLTGAYCFCVAVLAVGLAFDLWRWRFDKRIVDLDTPYDTYRRRLLLLRTATHVNTVCTLAVVPLFAVAFIPVLSFVEDGENLLSPSAWAMNSGYYLATALAATAVGIVVAGVTSFRERNEIRDWLRELQGMAQQKSNLSNNNN